MEHHATASEIQTKLNKKAQKQKLTPSHADFVLPIRRIQKTIDGIQRSVRDKKNDVEMVQEWLEIHQDIVLYPKDKKDFPVGDGKTKLLECY